MTPNIIDVTAATFDDAVLHGSQTVPIVVDFWAPWCAPCRTLAPVLEKLAAEYDGKFVLAKVNSDENQALAARFGVRGIPNVKAFVDGRLVDEFSGALPEPAVRDFIERLLPNPGEELRRAAMRDYAVGNATSALSKLDRVAELDPANRLAAVDRAEVLIALGRLEAARTALDSVDVLTRQEDRVKGLVARLNIAAGVEGAPDAATLEARIAADGNDLDARLPARKPARGQSALRAGPQRAAGGHDARPPFPRRRRPQADGGLVQHPGGRERAGGPLPAPARVGAQLTRRSATPGPCAAGIR